MTIRILPLAATLALLPAAAAATACAERERVVALLGERYGETRHGIGLAANNAVMEIYASAETGTWTIVVTTPDGTACMIASGEGYETLEDTLPPPGDKA